MRKNDAAVLMVLTAMALVANAARAQQPPARVANPATPPPTETRRVVLAAPGDADGASPATLMPQPFLDPLPLRQAAPASDAAADISKAEPSLLDRVASWWQAILEWVGWGDSAPSASDTAVLAATAYDPQTGSMRLESAAMACAATCEERYNEDSMMCHGSAPPQLATRSTTAADPNCFTATSDRHSSCLIACGLPAPAPLMPSTGSARPRSLPPIGTAAAAAFGGRQ